MRIKTKKERRMRRKGETRATRIDFKWLPLKRRSGGKEVKREALAEQEEVKEKERTTWEGDYEM